MDFIHFLRILRRRFLILLILPMVSVPIVIVLTMNMPKTYSTYLMINTGITSGGVSVTDNVQRFVLMTQTNNMLELAKSKTVYEITGMYLLYHDLTSSKPFRKPPKEERKFTQADEQKAIQILREIIEKDTKIVPDSLNLDDYYLILGLLRERGYDPSSLARGMKIVKLEGSDYIRFSFEAENPKLVAFTLNKMADVFIRKYRYMMAGEAIRSRKFFKEQTAQAYKRLQAKEKELRDYKTKHNVVLLSEQIRSVVSRIEHFGNLLNDNERTIESSKAIIWQIENQLSGQNDALQISNIVLLNQDVIRVSDELKQLETEYIRRKYELNEDELFELKQQIEKKRTEINQLIHKVWLEHAVSPEAIKQNLVEKLVQAKIDLEVAHATRNVIQRELQKFKEESKQYAPIEAKISQLQREIQVAEQEYIEMFQKLNLARTFERNVLSTTSVQVTESAIPPSKPQPSKRMILIILAGVGSFIFGVVATFVIEYLDVSIRTVKQAERATMMDITIGLPRVYNPERETIMLRTNPENIRQALTKESLRLLRSRILNHPNKPKLIAITSPQIGDGKSYLTATLGLILTEAHFKTLLVDGNLRNPNLEKYFVFKSSKKLIPYLKGEVELDQAAEETEHKNLFLMAGFESTHTFMEITGEKRPQQIVKELKENFDFVLLDTPAMNFYADFADILDQIELFLFIIRAGEPFPEANKRSLNHLKSIDQSRLMIVMNYCDTEALEPFFGEVPRERSVLHLFLKRILERRFGYFRRLIIEYLQRKN